MKKMVKICPACGSTNVTLPPSALDIKMTKQDYCADCEFWGNFPEVESTAVEKFARDLNKKK